MLGSEIELFLREDTGDFDLFHDLLPDKSIRARIVVKQDGTLAGITEATQIFDYCGVSSSCKRNDGETVADGEIVLKLEGNARAVLQSERVALNFIGRMSGIATLTRQCVEMIAHAGTGVGAGTDTGTGVRVTSTRKTTPGFRKFEKKAVVIGGGDPHRFNLTDAVMIKENHIKLYGMETAYSYARGVSFTKKVEIEVETAVDAIHAAKLGADIIMFDNMGADQIRGAVSELVEQGLRDSVLLEASGGITMDNLVTYAGTGVDMISMGALTHSSRWLDFSLEVD